MEISRVLMIVRSRWAGVLACVLLLAGLAVAMHLVLPPKYTTSAAVVVDVRGLNPVLGIASTNTPMPRSVLGTQASIVRSEGVARQVVTQLKLTEDAFYKSAWREDTDGQGDPTDWIARQLLKALDVRPAGEDSNVLDIQFSSRKAAQAAQVANAFATTYLSSTSSLRTDSARQNAGFFEQQAKALRAELEQAQTRLSAYQSQSGIVSSDERLDVETAALNELSSQLTSLRGERIDSSSRTQQAAGRSAVAPAVLSSPIVQQQTSVVASADARLNELKGRLGSQHPQVISAEEELAAAKASLKREMDRVVSSLKVSDESNRQRESELSAALQTQRRKVMALKANRDNVAVLERDVESARKAYEQVQARLSQTSQEGRSPMAEASVLSTAATPIKSARPPLALLLPMAVVVGAILGTLLALLREGRRPLVRTGSDLEVLDVPVLASVAHTHWRRPRHPIAAALPGPQLRELAR